MTKVKTIQKIHKLIELFDADLIPRLHQHEVNPGLPQGDRLNYLYFTLPVSINFQRNSPAMWAAALRTYEDPETNYLFYPEKVVVEQREKIQLDLAKHKLSLQRNKHADIWIRLCQTLNKYYENDPSLILAFDNYDVSAIINTLRVLRKKDFPYLSGTKMANYWLYILNQFTNVELNNLSLISIIPDTHVIQASVVLGITNPNDSPELVAQKWFDLLEGTDVSPIQMHPILWNWSRAGFNPMV